MTYKAKGKKKSAREVTAEIQAEIAQKFIDCLNEGVIPWKQPWNSTKHGYIGSSGKPYGLMNAFMLYATGGSPNEYVSVIELANRTHTRVDDKSVWGNLVRDKDGKAPRAHRIVFYKPMPYIKKDAEGNELLDEKGNPIMGTFPILRSYAVYEVGVQVNCPYRFHYKDENKEKDNLNVEHACEKLKLDYLAREGITLTHNPNEGYYEHVSDMISIPFASKFSSVEAYYSTIFHEMVHSTGNKKRLNRDVGRRHEGTKYDFEELVAEIGACTLLHDMGIATESTDLNSENYVKGWISVFQRDPKIVEKACRKATEAVNYIYGIKKTKESED